MLGQTEPFVILAQILHNRGRKRDKAVAFVQVIEGKL